MKFSDLLSMCVRNLTRRKFRTFLTIIGVVIGTCAIVIMISIGEGIRASNEAFLASRGDLTVITVYGHGGSADVTLDDASIAQIQAIPGVDVATPFMTYQPDSSSMELYSGKKERYAFWSASWSMIGIEPEAMEKLGYTAKAGGSTLTQSDGKNLQMVFGSMVVYDFEDTKKRWPNSYINGWPDENGDQAEPFFDPMTAEYALKIPPGKEGAKALTFNLHVVGILDAQSREYEKMWNIYMDIGDLKRIKADYEKANNIKKDRDVKESYNEARVKAVHIDNVGEVEVAIQNMGFQTYSMESMRESLQENAKQIQNFLAIIGGAALFVAAISIANTMIMSVYERTREIGVMKVLGCLVSDIRSIFLIEAGLIGFLGGVLGVGISCLLSFLLNTFGGSIGNIVGMIPSDDGARFSIIPPWLMLLGLGFSTLIGLIFGFIPALRAMKISALEAIKQE